MKNYLKPGKSQFMKISGLQCDKSHCGYIDKDINADDYEKYINAPCPSCGSSLLTQNDFNSIQRMLKIERFFIKVLKIMGININHKKFEDNDFVSLSMNGTGNIFIKKD